MESYIPSITETPSDPPSLGGYHVRILSLVVVVVVVVVVVIIVLLLLIIIVHTHIHAYMHTYIHTGYHVLITQFRDCPALRSVFLLSPDQRSSQGPT